MALLVFMLFACLALPAHAESPERRAAKFASENGNILFLALGVALPALEDGSKGWNRSVRVADALGTSVLITEGLKALTREKRPDTDEHNSFPSGHATAAFAVATMESAYHPEQKTWWYLGATLIAASRVRLNRHHTQDVVAGAVVGYTTARWELSRPRGLVLAPFIRPDGEGIEMQWGHAF
jgi:membrane-associated phospholipid phosphatase